MKNKDVFALKEKAYEVYEKLSVLAYVEEYINTTPNPEHTKEELIEKIEQAATIIEESVAEPEPTEEVVVHNLEDVEAATEEETTEESVEESSEEETPEEIIELTVGPEVAEEAPKAEEETIEETVEETSDEVEKEEPETIELVLEPEVVEETPKAEEETVEETTEETLDEVEEEEPEIIELALEPEVAEEETKEEEVPKAEEKKAPSLEEELKDTIAVDVVADLFENAPKKSLNDKLHGDIQIGLNDRIAFVKNLFDGSQEDFNRVVSQLNTFKTEKEAKKFLNKMVKPDYNWSEKEEYEERFMSIVERKFA